MSSVSIIIPFFKREAKLINLIKTLNQINYNKKSIELLIIVDGCKINKNLIDGQSKLNILFINNKKNLGPSYSRNQGLNISKSEYIWFLDSDALVEDKEILNKMMLIINRKKIDGITGYYEVIDNEKLVQTPLFFPNLINLEKFQNINNFSFNLNDMVAMTSLFVNKNDFINKFGFFDNMLRIKEDEELISRVKRKDRNFLISKDMLVEHLPDKISMKVKFNHIVDIIKVRSYKFSKNNELYKLFFFDIIYLPIIFFLYFFSKKTTSRRFKTFKGSLNFNDYIKLLFLLIKNYIIKTYKF